MSEYIVRETGYPGAVKQEVVGELVRCKDCKHRIVNANPGEIRYHYLKAVCELDTGDPFELGRNAWNDEWYCADAERREEGE